MPNETSHKTLDLIAKDPRVRRIYKDDVGLWVELAAGWVSSRDNPPTHLICEEKVAELWHKYRGLKACECDACATAPVFVSTPAQVRVEPGTPPINPATGTSVPNEVRARRATRASRIRHSPGVTLAPGEVDAIGHAGGSVHKWRCVSCRRWVREEIGRACAACRAKPTPPPEPDSQEVTDGHVEV